MKPNIHIRRGVRIGEKGNKRTVSKLFDLQKVLQDIELKEIRLYPIYLAITGTHNNVKGIPRIYKDRVKFILNKWGGLRSMTDFCEKSLKKKTFSKVKKELQKLIDNEQLIKDNFFLVFPYTVGLTLSPEKQKRNIKQLMKECHKYKMKSLVRKLEMF
jgi:hypothetical protein